MTGRDICADAGGILPVFTSHESGLFLLGHYSCVRLFNFDCKFQVSPWNTEIRTWKTTWYGQQHRMNKQQYKSYVEWVIRGYGALMLVTCKDRWSRKLEITKIFFFQIIILLILQTLKVCIGTTENINKELLFNKRVE